MSSVDGEVTMPERGEPLQNVLQNSKDAEWASFDACVAPSNTAHILSHSHRRRKPESLIGSFRSWTLRNQIGIAANLLLLHALAHICFPRARRRTRSFFQLSYYHESTNLYTQGPEDLYFVSYWIIMFTGMRAAVMSYILLPLAGALEIRKTKKKVRFAEQAWLFLYYLVFWSIGMYLMYNSKYWLNLKELWTDFPTRSMTGLLKWYYLVQLAFWLQQIVVVNIEERRKDHWQMFTHHVVTCLLVSGSYGIYQTKVGNVVLCAMDIVDVVFPAAKMLKYAGYQSACDMAFGIFILSWFFARHVCYLAICWSLYADAPAVMSFGCYSSGTGQQLSGTSEPGWETASTPGGNFILNNIFQAYLDPEGPVCFEDSIWKTFLALLLFLQGITIMWFTMIMRVAWNVVKGHGADDSRSDDEEDVDAEDEEVAADDAKVSASIAVPQEQLVGVESLNFKPKGSSRYRSRKAASHASGISIATHPDKKELLGRIGCDKPT